MDSNGFGASLISCDMMSDNKWVSPRVCVCRNISSDGEYARKKLRECEGLCDSIFFIVRAAIGKNDIDNKCVENCVCLLRNLSYACQEVEDPSYLKRRTAPKQGDKGGCWPCIRGAVHIQGRELKVGTGRVYEGPFIYREIKVGTVCIYQVLFIYRVER